MPSFSVERGSYNYFLSFKARPFTRNLGGFVDERRTIPAFLTYMVLCALCFFAMHSWHFVWSLVNAYYAAAYQHEHWYFEFDVVLVASNAPAGRRVDSAAAAEPARLARFRRLSSLCTRASVLRARVGPGARGPSARRCRPRGGVKR